MSVILSVCLSVCPHDKTKTAETKIAKLATCAISRPSINIRSKDQGHSVKSAKRRDKTALRRRLVAVTPLNKTAPHDRHELCTLLSAQLLVLGMSCLLLR